MTALARRSSDVRFRRCAKGLAAAFLLVAAYTLATKLPEGRMHHDWLHSVLHLGTGAAAVWAGWFTTSAVPARILTVVVAISYTALGVVGWTTPGFLLDTTLAVPLAAPDNAFHLVLGLSSLLVVVLPQRPRAPR